MLSLQLFSSTGSNDFIIIIMLKIKQVDFFFFFFYWQALLAETEVCKPYISSHNLEQVYFLILNLWCVNEILLVCQLINT